ncbi:MAG TPA: hypothetical protein VEC38_02505 [Candidatus Binataceae bacterium]|nr:hypothetical protein [Candidatus Binataceae bacterium]
MPSIANARLSGLLLLASMLAAILLSAGGALAFSFQDYEGDVQLGEWQGQVEGGFQFENQESSTPSSTLTAQDYRWDERLKLRNDGIYIIDPRLITMDAAVDLDLYQEQDNFSEGKGLYEDGLLWGYDVSAAVLPLWPENGTLFANQSQTYLNTTFGGHTTTDTMNYGMTAQVLEDSFLRGLGVSYFTSRLSAVAQNFDQKTTQLGETFQLDEQHDVVSYVANKGFQTADLMFHYEFDNDHLTGTTHSGFQTNVAGLSYFLDFGPDLNRSLNSDIYGYTLSGTSGSQEFLSLNEVLRIDHYQNLSTTYQYQFQYNDVPDYGVTTYQYGQFTLLQSMFRNLNESLILGFIRETVPTGTITNYWVGAESDYTHTLPWNGMFFLDTNGVYGIEDDDISSSVIHVTDESHTAPPIFGTNLGFFLNNTFVIANSIVMVDVAHGRVPTVLNVDYDVLQIGNQTEIVPLPTSLIIHPGDPLLVSYNYQVPAKSKFSTSTRQVTVGVTYPWFYLSYSYQAISQNLLSGTGSQFLESSTANSVSGGVHHEWETFGARADATYQTVDSTSVSFNSTMLSQAVTARPGWEAVLAASASETFMDYTLPRHQTKTYAFQLSGDRPIGERGRASMFAIMSEVEDSQIPTTKQVEVGAQMTYTIGKLQFLPSLSWYRRTFSTTTTNDLLVQIRVVRILF